jgi:hypothetical protein
MKIKLRGGGAETFFPKAAAQEIHIPSRKNSQQARRQSIWIKSLNIRALNNEDGHHNKPAVEFPSKSRQKLLTV